MVKVETLKEDGFVRILRCREDNRILCEHVGMWDSGYLLIRGVKISWYSKGSTVPLNLTFKNKK